ncbi:MAG TPA: multiprotein bridging factor aMBF1 [Candidatus Nanoarchaeia archaeon]|nr:multiprotein bridging factor aMBF1 [Candidatus Nanoarchaeia archaeon]
MTQCDMCGSLKPLVSALVEGTTLQVCSSCSRYGKVLPKLLTPQHQLPAAQLSKQRAEAELDFILVSDFAFLIKQSREQKKLQQKDLALAVKEKESVIQHVESGRLQPSLHLAKKLEKYLHISLVQLYIPPEKSKTSSDGTLTIGDLVNLRKRS